MKDLKVLTQGPRPYAILIVMVAILSLPGVFRMPVLDRDEARFTQATAQMLETGDFVVIRFHDGLRNKKPVGIHWLQAASVAAFSDVDERQIWAWRLPSLFGAMLTVCALYWAGVAMFSRTAAFTGAVLTGCTLLVSSEAHIAKTDSAMVGFITLSLAALAHLRAKDSAKRSVANGASGRSEAADTERKRLMRTGWDEKGLGVLFWFALGWGVLIKGPIAPMIAGLTIITLLMWERRVSWLRALAFWPGPLLAMLITIPWFVAVQIATEGAFLNEAVGVDLGPKMVSGAEGHSGPPGYHLAFLPLLFWPSTLLLIPGLAYAGERLFRRKVGEPPVDLDGWRFLIAWIIPAFIVFEATPTKLAHYPLPLYPALALMAGLALDRLMDYRAEKRAPVWPRWTSLFIFCLISTVLLVIMSPWGLSYLRIEGAGEFSLPNELNAAAEWQHLWNEDGAPFWPFLLALLSIGGLVWTFLEKRYKSTLGLIFVCSLVIGGSLRGELLPKQSWTLSTHAAVDVLNEVCGMPYSAHRDIACGGEAPSVVRAIAYSEPSLVFQTNGNIILPPKTTAELPPRSKETRPAWLIDIAKDEGREALRFITEQATQAQRCVRIERRLVHNYSNGDASELAAIVVEPNLCDPLNDAVGSTVNLEAG